MRELDPSHITRLADYFASELPPEARAELERWIEDEPSRQAWVARLMRSRIDFRASDVAGDSEAESLSAEAALVAAQVTDRIRHRVDGTASPEIRDVEHDRSSVRETRRDRVRAFVPWSLPGSLRSGRYTVAGMALCLIAVVAGWRAGMARQTTPHTQAGSSYTTGNGERATITLPDGSTVVLNVASRVQIPARFGFGERKVYLSGEALFTVAHHGGRPFTVIAGPSTTRVLGTSFIVRHYASDSAAVVAVREGKVSVDSVVVTRAQQISVGWNRRGVVSMADTTQFSFARGLLVLNATPLRDAIPRLNRWYNVDIRLADAALGERRISSEFAIGTVMELASILDATFDDIGVIRDGRTITLYRR